MSLKSDIAKTASRDVLGGIGSWFRRLGHTIGELFEGSWVRKETHTFATGITEKTFANGVHVIEKPGAAAVATVPARWLEGKEPVLRQWREGSLMVRESFNFETKVGEKTLANGIKVVQAPGKAAAVTLPKRMLTGPAPKL